jgi:hypothetical protein
MANDKTERTTLRPPKGSGSHFARSAVDSVKLDEAQTRIIEAFRTGVLGLVNRFFDEAMPVVRKALLHVGVDLYDDGIRTANERSRSLITAYLAALERAMGEMPRDPRIDPVLPDVTSLDVATELARLGVSLQPAEVAVACGRVGLPLAPEDAVE